LLNVVLDFQSSSEEIKAKKIQLRNAAIEMVNKIMREKAGNIVWYMERKFNNKFKLDAQGVPRVWKPSDDIKAIYMEAKRDVSFSCKAMNSFFFFLTWGGFRVRNCSIISLLFDCTLRTTS